MAFFFNRIAANNNRYFHLMKAKVTCVLVLMMLTLTTCNKNSVFSGAKIDTVTDFLHQYILTYTYNPDSGPNPEELINISKNTLGDSTFSYSGNTVIQAGGEDASSALPL